MKTRKLNSEDTCDEVREKSEALIKMAGACSLHATWSVTQHSFTLDTLRKEKTEMAKEDYYYYNKEMMKIM